MTELTERHRITREYLRDEAEHMRGRFGWLLAANAFLVGPYVIAAGIGTETRNTTTSNVTSLQVHPVSASEINALPGRIAILGLALSIGLLVLMLLAWWADHRILRYLMAEEVGSEIAGEVGSKTRREQMDSLATAGGTRPDVRGGRVVHQLGLALPPLLAVSLIVFWVAVL